MDFPLSIIRPGDNAPAELALGINDLLRCVWPPAPDAKVASNEEIVAQWSERREWHVVRRDQEQGRVLAHAGLFEREILTERGPLKVGALVGVCVHPDFRGRGWGAEVVSQAFALLPEVGAGVSLFQTGVPEFYEKIGARRVLNGFRNGDDEANPFWEGFALIYPGEFAWPAGAIDLNGPGY